MTIRTLEQLEFQIAEDIAWRKKELSQIKAVVQSRETSTIRKKAFIRCGTTMLYAHWEGFIKNTSQWYLEFVLSRRLTYRQLSANFVAIAMQSKLNQATQSNKTTGFIYISEFFLNKLDDRCRFSTDGLINTKSNLSSTVLKELMLLLGLDYSFFETKEKFIDLHIVKDRNVVAHGNYLAISPIDFLDRFDRIISMMEYYRNQIENAAIHNQFMS